VAILLQNEHVCIQEDLGEIKAAVKSRAAPEFWQTVITKLLELITTAFIILAGIWGLAKFIKP
jgi:hypothetical protein